jgi:hypothetical protein
VNNGQPGKLAIICNPLYSLTNEIAESVSDEGSAIPQGAWPTEAFFSHAKASSP